MTPRDTSKEYVERMCRCAPFADNEAGIPEMVAMLRALLAERDAARAEAARLREAHTELDTWARAEITRLRRLWTYMQEAAADIEADEPMTAAEWLAEFATAEADRAALATEARDE